MSDMATYYFYLDEAIRNRTCSFCKDYTIPAGRQVLQLLVRDRHANICPCCISRMADLYKMAKKDKTDKYYFIPIKNSLMKQAGLADKPTE